MNVTTMKTLDELMAIREVAANCEEHGPYTAKLVLRGSVRIGCPVCSEIKRKADEAKRLEEEMKEKARRWQKRLNDSCIPPRFQDRTLDTFKAVSADEKAALAMAIAYEPDDVLKTGRCLIITGKPGTGKTHLSVGIANEWMRSGNTVLFRGVMAAVQLVTETWRRDSDMTQSAAIRLLLEPDLLILDEVGVQSGSDAEKNVIFEIMNARYENRRPTVLLSNLAVGKLAEFLGERVMDRLREDGGKAIYLDGESKRGKVGK